MQSKVTRNFLLTVSVFHYCFIHKLVPLCFVLFYLHRNEIVKSGPLQISLLLRYFLNGIGDGSNFFYFHLFHHIFTSTLTVVGENRLPCTPLTKCIGSNIKIVLRLQSNPELRGCSEEPCKPEGCISSDLSLFKD